MGWADEISDGYRELISDGAGVTILRGGRDISAMLGGGISLNQLIDGGFMQGVNPSISIHRSDLDAEGWSPKQGDIFKVKEDATRSELKVASVGFDPADPLVKLYVEGRNQ